MKMHSALTARPVIDRLDDLLVDCRPPANPEPQRVLVEQNAFLDGIAQVDVLVAAIDVNAPAKPKREQPTLRRTGIRVPEMPRIERPWDGRVF